MEKKFKSLADHNFSKYEVSDDGVFRHVRTGNLSYGSVDGGYRKRALIDDNGISCNKGVHQWIAMAWIPNPMGKKQVDHIDGNRLNNTVTNLKWATNSENMNNMVVNKRKRDSSMQLPYSPKKVSSFVDLKFGDQIWVMNGKNIAHNIYIYVSCNKKSDKYIFMNTTTGAATVLNANHLKIENWFMYEYTDDFKSYFNQVNRVIIENI